MVGGVTIVTYAVAGLTGSIVALPVGIVLLVVTVLVMSKLYGKAVHHEAGVES